REGRTMYEDPSGIAVLREEVLRWLKVENHYDPSSVVITAGAKQSLFNIFLAVCNPADCVLFDTAPWVSYQPLAVSSYAVPIMVLPAAGESNHLKVTPDDLRRNLSMRPQVRLFLLNNPVNPTAQLYSAAEVEGLLQVCVEHRIYFVLDRLYWKLIFDNGTFPEPRLDKETLPWVIQVDGVSKNFRRTGGLRIGWSISPPDVARAMANLQSHYTSGPAVPTQHSALAAIAEPYDYGLRTDLQRKRDLLHQEVRALPHIKVWPTPATFYSFWDVRELFGRKTPAGTTLKTSNDVMEYLIRDAGVVTASGTGFMQDGYLRISFATPEDHIVKGIRSAAEALASLSAT
ncbi:MAG: aminotransferase class I/II-fold pyridoxal phosphate-dependent enzyme, partial [Gemmatimonadales bacterium]